MMYIKFSSKDTTAIINATDKLIKVLRLNQYLQNLGNFVVLLEGS